MLNQPDVDAFMAQVEQNRLVAMQDADRKQAMDELLAFCSSWLQSAKDWRSQSFEDKWHEFQRSADAVYDPKLKSLKEAWQSKAFIPLIPSHRETIQSELFKMVVGARPVLEVKARNGLPQEIDQSENIQTLIIRAMEQSRFEVGFNAVLEDVTTFGSGFVRIRHETVTEDRRVRQPVHAPVDPLQVQIAASQGMLPPQPQIAGYQETIQEVPVYRGVKFEPLSIWDVFPDPKALQIRGNPIAYRFYYTYGEVVKGSQQGYFFPEAEEKLRDVPESSYSPEEKQQVEADREIGQANVRRTKYGQRLECYELWAKLPKKWVYLRGEPIDDPEKLVPARVIFVPGHCVLTIEENANYDGEPDIYKCDYLPVAGQFYARGIPEMLKDLQLVINESVNQRLDSNAILLKPKFAVIDKALVNPKDLEWDGHAAIRLNAKHVNDVRLAFQQVEMRGLSNMAIIDPQEMERYAQERTSANRMTLGTAGQVKDTNETLGGQQLLLNQAHGKFAYVGMLMEFSFLYDVFRAYWKQIYSNLDPQDVVTYLGPEKAMTFQLLTPEQIEQEYTYMPQGIFEMQNKALLQARIDAIVSRYGGQPWFDIMAAFDKTVKTANMEPNELKLSPEEMQERIFAEGLMNMPPAQPGKPGEPKDPVMGAMGPGA